MSKGTHTGKEGRVFREETYADEREMDDIVDEVEGRGK